MKLNINKETIFKFYKENKTIVISFFFIIILSPIIINLIVNQNWLTFILPEYFTLNKEKLERMGTFGDTFGFLNSIFSGLAFLGLVITIYLQNKQIDDQITQFNTQKNQLDTQFNIQLTHQKQQFDEEKNHLIEQMDLQKKQFDVQNKQFEEQLNLQKQQFQIQVEMQKEHFKKQIEIQEKDSENQMQQFKKQSIDDKFFRYLDYHEQVKDKLIKNKNNIFDDFIKSLGKKIQSNNTSTISNALNEVVERQVFTDYFFINYFRSFESLIKFLEQVKNNDGDLFIEIPLSLLKSRLENNELIIIGLCYLISVPEKSVINHEFQKTLDDYKLINYNEITFTGINEKIKDTLKENYKN